MRRTAKDGSWLIYAVLSAVFASLTAILGKIGISGIDSNLGTAIRTTVVLVMAWLMVFMKGKQHEVREIEKKELLFIGLSGIATGASWLFYYRALQEGPASVVVPIDKLSILVTIAFSWIRIPRKTDTESCCWCGTDHTGNSNYDDGVESMLHLAQRIYNLLDEIKIM